jgi:hypothetical protein
MTYVIFSGLTTYVFCNAWVRSTLGPISVATGTLFVEVTRKYEKQGPHYSLGLVM